MNEKKTVRPENVPSAQQLERWYREEKREQTEKVLAHPVESTRQDCFFAAFGKTEAPPEERGSDAADNPYYDEYRGFKEKEIAKQKKKIIHIENQIAYEWFFLRYQRQQSYEQRGFTHFGSTPATRYRVDRIVQLENQLESLLEASPEGWEFYYSRQFLRDVESQKEQRLVDVPYVVRARKSITQALELGTPVYLVGHLGSGKTQLATEAAMEFSIARRVQNELEEKMEQWYADHSDATESQAFQAFTRYYHQRQGYYHEILAHGSKDELESLYPLFISGSHNLTYEDMFVEKTLRLEHSFSHGSFAEYLNRIVVDFYQWMEEHRQQLDAMTEEEQLQLKIQIWKSFSDLLVAKNSAFGTVIEKTEKEILQAVKEGRPVIVDELNTIAMQNLIALNDILQRHAGSKAYITGVGPVTIQPGFAFIGTGNLSTQGVSYEGTNVLNPAFKSRFITLEYNYVPQNTTGGLLQQTRPEDNQLFRILLAHLADQEGGLWLPAPQRSLEELFRLAQLSRVTQDVFMGKWEEDSSRPLAGEVQLKESVLSIRNILHVLDNWNMGEEKDMSLALWEGFISSVTDPDDQSYLLSQALRFGFFPKEEGWNVEPRELGQPTITYEEIRTAPYTYLRPAGGAVSLVDVVGYLFGSTGEREWLPQELQKKWGLPETPPPNLTAQEYEKLDEKLTHLERAQQISQHLQEGAGSEEKS